MKCKNDGPLRHYAALRISYNIGRAMDGKPLGRSNQVYKRKGSRKRGFIPPGLIPGPHRGPSVSSRGRFLDLNICLGWLGRENAKSPVGKDKPVVSAPRRPAWTATSTRQFPLLGKYIAQ